jgi:hypothetical protein
MKRHGVVNTQDIADPGNHINFETNQDSSGSAWLQWDFSTPVIVTKIEWDWNAAAAGRSRAVSLTGSLGGQATVGYDHNGAEQRKMTADYGADCLDCPKGGSIKFSAVDGDPFGKGNWGASNVRIWGCTKDGSKHNHFYSGGESEPGVQSWSPALYNMNQTSGECPAGYQDADYDGSCQRCTTAADCGPGATFNGTKCSTHQDNTCTPCTKPFYSTFTKSGVCTFICTSGYTGPQCDQSNVCSETKVVLGDGQGDGWNGASAHVSALTGPNQLTYFAEAAWADGTGTNVGNSAPATAEHVFTCMKDGCYAVHFSDIGSAPEHVYILGSDGNEHDTIVPMGNLTETRQKFMFKVSDGWALSTSYADCNLGPFVQLDELGTLAPGATHAPGLHDVHTRNNRAASFDLDAASHDYTASPTAYPTPMSRPRDALDNYNRGILEASAENSWDN